MSLSEILAQSVLCWMGVLVDGPGAIVEGPGAIIILESIVRTVHNY